MLSNYAKERLVQAIADQDVADEIEKRLIQSSPASAQDAQDLLDSFVSLDIEEYCAVAFANADIGAEISDRIAKAKDVLEAKAASASLVNSLAAFGSEEMSEEAFDQAVIALADEDAAEEFKEYYNQFVSAVSSIS